MQEEQICAGCIIRRRPGSPNVLFVFSAVDIPLGQVPGGERLFNTKNFDANIVILNDSRKQWYLRGIEGLGCDVPGTASRLKALQDELGGKGWTIAYGNSMGAFGACLFGGLLNVDLVIAPGVQLLAPNPMGVFRNYNGKRINIRQVMANSSAFFHLLVGECFPGDIIGCFKVLDLPNVYIQTVRNFGHGVTGYMNTMFGAREIINNYLTLLTEQQRSDSSFREPARAQNIFRTPLTMVNKDDAGTLLQYKIAALYLYSTEIMLRLRKGDRQRRLRKLREIAMQMPDNTIKSYLYFSMAKLFRASPNFATHYIEQTAHYAKAAFALNQTSPTISQFLSSFYHNLRNWEDCFFWSQIAISCRHGNIPIYLYNEKHNPCYAEQIDSLRNLGLPKPAASLGEHYKDAIPEFKRRHQACASDYAALEKALERCKNI